MNQGTAFYIRWYPSNALWRRWIFLCTFLLYHEILSFLIQKWVATMGYKICWNYFPSRRSDVLKFPSRLVTLNFYYYTTATHCCFQAVFMFMSNFLAIVPRLASVYSVQPFIFNVPQAWKFCLKIFQIFFLMKIDLYKHHHATGKWWCEVAVE